MIDAHDVQVQEVLLGRKVRPLLSEADRRAFTGQRVLITGAGGSVGTELARQVAGCAPARLTLFDQCEYNLFQLERELATRWPAVPLDPVLGDVTRLRHLQSSCRQARPHVVYHAAAYKHVTMLERATTRAIEVNVFGTLNTCRAAQEVGARLVMISSDKAAQPRSVMGATKRMAELVAVSLASQTFRPVVTRFGNVLASSGSVVEIMLEQIRRRQPIPLRDPRATRYFMTATEAVSLVLKADRLGRGGEIYWLDMGAPVSIRVLARRLLALAQSAGLDPVPVTVVGLRPGEKLCEELTSQGLELCRTAKAGIWVARQPPVDLRLVQRVIRALRHSVVCDNALAALADLQAVVPEFEPSPEAYTTAAEATVGTLVVNTPAIAGCSA